MERLEMLIDQKKQDTPELLTKLTGEVNEAIK